MGLSFGLRRQRLVDHIRDLLIINAAGMQWSGFSLQTFDTSAGKWPPPYTYRPLERQTSGAMSVSVVPPAAIRTILARIAGRQGSDLELAMASSCPQCTHIAVTRGYGFPDRFDVILCIQLHPPA